MKTMEIEVLNGMCIDGRVTEVKISAISNYTGEYIEVRGYARCASGDKFDYNVGHGLAYTRAVRKAYEYFLKAHKWILANTNLKERNKLEFKRTVNELLEIQKELIATNLLLNTLVE